MKQTGAVFLEPLENVHGNPSAVVLGQDRQVSLQRGARTLGRAVHRVDDHTHVHGARCTSGGLMRALPDAPLMQVPAANLSSLETGS